MKILNDDEYRAKAKELDTSLDDLLPDDSVYATFINSLDVNKLDNKDYVNSEIYKFMAGGTAGFVKAMELGANYEAWKQGVNGI